MMQIWRKSDKNKKNIEVWRRQNCFFERRHFEYLQRIFDVIKPELNKQNLIKILFAI